MMTTRVCRLLLLMTGVLLVASSIFSLAVVTSRAHDRHEINSIILSALLILLCGIGFLLPQLSTNLLSALALAGAAVWLFFADAFRSQNWWIDGLFFIPLLLTLWLANVKASSSLRGVSNAN